MLVSVTRAPSAHDCPASGFLCAPVAGTHTSTTLPTSARIRLHGRRNPACCSGNRASASAAVSMAPHATSLGSKGATPMRSFLIRRRQGRGCGARRAVFRRCIGIHATPASAPSAREHEVVPCAGRPGRPRRVAEGADESAEGRIKSEAGALVAAGLVIAHREAAPLLRAEVHRSPAGLSAVRHLIVALWVEAAMPLPRSQDQFGLDRGPTRERPIM